MSSQTYPDVPEPLTAIIVNPPGITDPIAVQHVGRLREMRLIELGLMTLGAVVRRRRRR